LRKKYLCNQKWEIISSDRKTRIVATYSFEAVACMKDDGRKNYVEENFWVKSRLKMRIKVESCYVGWRRNWITFKSISFSSMSLISPLKVYEYVLLSVVLDGNRSIRKSGGSDWLKEDPLSGTTISCDNCFPTSPPAYLMIAPTMRPENKEHIHTKNYLHV
jgi:hypothetical protein